MEVDPKTDKIVQCRGFGNNQSEKGGKAKSQDIFDFEKEFACFINEEKSNKKTHKKPKKQEVA